MRTPSFALGSAKLPEVEEAETPRVLFEERIALLKNLNQGLASSFGSFLKVRASSQWDAHVTKLRRWISHAPKAAAAMV